MFFYARADTHYLLYIYDNLRNELVGRSDLANPEENRIELVIQKSKETSLQRFERQIYDAKTGKGPGGWYTLLIKTPAFFTNEQFAVFRAVHAWRDEVARQDDESTTYVMTNNVLFALTRLMPMDMVALYGTLHPISHSVKSRATVLLALIQSAKASGKDGPSMTDVLRPDSIGATSKSKYNSKSAYELPSVLLDQGSLRNEVSMFWGMAFGSSIWDPQAPINDGMELKLAVPLPRLASDALDSSSCSLADRPPPTKDQSLLVGAQLTTSIDNTGDEAFTIKGGRKRKISAVTDEIEESKSKGAPVLNPIKEPHIPLNQEEKHEARDEAALKAEKRARKKLAKAQQQLAQENDTVSSLPEESQEDFDYSKAESVLRGVRRDDDLNSPKGKKPFDPYSKSSDAPKGLRRLQTERTGKSYTFKS
jgi:exosome complex exonuclease RRP6